MKNALIAIAFLIGAAGAHAQATTAAKEAGKATSETAKQGTENTKAAVSSEPKKTEHKAKASTHKAKAKSHGHESKEAAKGPSSRDPLPDRRNDAHSRRFRRKTGFWPRFFRPRQRLSRSRGAAGLRA